MLTDREKRIVADRIDRSGKVWIWFLGPPRPIAPTPPVEPKKTGKAADDALAEVLFEDAVGDYKKQLREYGDHKKEYDKWREMYGGPRKEYHWDIDVQHALQFPDQWVMDLPSGMKPGKAQLAAEQQAAEEKIALQELYDRDPQFGTAKPQFQGAAG
jgi:hypothetical protein